MIALIPKILCWTCHVFHAGLDSELQDETTSSEGYRRTWHSKSTTFVWFSLSTNVHISVLVNREFCLTSDEHTRTCMSNNSHMNQLGRVHVRVKWRSGPYVCIKQRSLTKFWDLFFFLIDSMQWCGLVKYWMVSLFTVHSVAR